MKVPIKKIYLSLIIFGFLIVFLIVLIIFPLFKGIQKNSEDLVSQKKKLILLQEERESLGQIKTAYESNQLNLDQIDRFFVDPEVPVEFINFLEKQAIGSGLLFKVSSMVKEIEKETSESSLSVQISVIGSFPNFLKFLEKLESGHYLVEVINLNAQRLNSKNVQLKDFEEFSGGDVSSNLLIRALAK